MASWVESQRAHIGDFQGVKHPAACELQWLAWECNKEAGSASEADASPPDSSSLSVRARFCPRGIRYSRSFCTPCQKQHTDMTLSLWMTGQYMRFPCVSSALEHVRDSQAYTHLCLLQAGLRPADSM